MELVQATSGSSTGWHAQKNQANSNVLTRPALVSLTCKALELVECIQSSAAERCCSRKSINETAANKFMAASSLGCNQVSGIPNSSEACVHMVFLARNES